MPRPRILRRVGFRPGIVFFKPAGIRMVDLEEVVLTVDESEAIRLKDYLSLDQKEAAEKMNVSQPTFSRLVEAARKKIADALVNGKAIRIEGGNFEYVGGFARTGRGGRGDRRGRGFGWGRRGRNI
ncbi:hypothetical protein DRJ17_05235 [Candidatus Woesearchaeota archaeon]|nr:MAG: hypothetical protein DRJ17_05235 [Candidatus Woesearchaeota archaeon]